MSMLSNNLRACLNRIALYEFQVTVLNGVLRIEQYNPIQTIWFQLALVSKEAKYNPILHNKLPTFSQVDTVSEFWLVFLL